jgi:hypothetical protein
MLGGSGLPSHNNWYITRIFLAVVLDGWETHSPISQDSSSNSENEEEEEERKAKACALQELFFVT